MENQLNKNEFKYPDDQLSGTKSFSYAVDDSLNVLVNQSVQKVFSVSQTELVRELQMLEKDNQIKFDQNFKINLDRHNDELRVKILKLNKEIEQLKNHASSVNASAVILSNPVNTIKSSNSINPINNEASDTITIHVPEPILPPKAP